MQVARLRPGRAGADGGGTGARGAAGDGRGVAALGCRGVPSARHQYPGRNSDMTEISLRFSELVCLIMTRSRYFTLGLANPPAARPYRRLGRADVGSAAHRQLNLEAARGGIVLLQNKPAEGGGLPVLPLRKGQTIAAVGPNAQATNNLLSNYHPPAPPEGSSSAIVLSLIHI